MGSLITDAQMAEKTLLDRQKPAITRHWAVIELQGVAPEPAQGSSMQ
jgi:hypothetical protein